MSDKENDDSADRSPSADGYREVERLRTALALHRKQQVDHICRAWAATDVAKTLREHLHEVRNDLLAIGRMVDDDIARTNEIGDNAQVLLTEAGDRIGAIARRTNEVLAKEKPTRWAESSAHDLVIAARKVDDIGMDAHALPEALSELRAALDALEVQERVDAGMSFDAATDAAAVGHSKDRRGHVENQLARRLDPVAWAEFDDGNGTCSHQAGAACMNSLKQAAGILPLMERFADLGAIAAALGEAESNLSDQEIRDLAEEIMQEQRDFPETDEGTP